MHSKDIFSAIWLRMTAHMAADLIPVLKHDTLLELIVESLLWDRLNLLWYP